MKLFLLKHFSKVCLALAFLLFSFHLKSQVNFVLSPTVCAGDTLSLTATNGTFSANAYSWTAFPQGPWFSSSFANHTDLSFFAAGIYTIYVSASNGTAISTASHVIVVYPQPNISVSSSQTFMCAGNEATLTASGAQTYFWEPQNQVSAIAVNQVYINLYVSTVFTVVGVNNIGCKNNITFTQQVVPYPNLQIVASQASLCPGATATLTGGGASTYTWLGYSAGSQTVLVGSGTYTLVGSNGGQCTDSLVYTLTTLAPFTVQATADRYVRCLNDSLPEPGITLSASGASSYTWQPYHPSQMTFSLGASVYVSPTVTTCYTVTGNNLGCLETATVCIQVSPCAGFTELADNRSETVVFPNPAKDRVFIKTRMTTPVTVNVWDLSGRLLLPEQPLQPDGSIALGTLIAGIYNLEIRWEQGREFHHLIVE